MASFKTKDRVLETSITTGAGDYTLIGAATGFQTFVGGVVSANDLVPYYAEDGTSWEAGIGTVLSGPSRLQRTHVLSSSNSGSAVNWGVGARNLRCGWPAELNTPRRKTKSVAGSANVTLSQDEQRCHILELTGVLTGNIDVIVDATVWNWSSVLNGTSGNFTITLKVSGQPGVELFQGRAVPVICNGTDVRKVAEDTPPGVLIDYAGSAVVSGYALASDGSNVSRATYSALFNKIGTTWGVGDGSTTFGLPDTRRRTAVGSGGSGTGTLGNAVGNSGGAETHTLSSGEMPVHAHTQQGNFSSGSHSVDHSHLENNQSAYNIGGSVTVASGGAAMNLRAPNDGTGLGQQSTGGANTGHTHDTTISGSTTNAGSGSAHNNMQPSYVVTKMIRV